MIKFQINARPQPKERSRSTRSGHHYTPSRTVNFEMTVAAEFRAQHPFHELLTGSLAMQVKAFYMRPKTVKKPLWHTGAGDLDNIVKAISDGLNGVAWKDDRQIAYLHAEKQWADADQIIVSIWPIF